MNELLDASISQFQSTFGDTPTLSSFAPGRINLIGEHTDYNDGYVMPIAIAQGVCVVASTSDDQMELISRELGVGVSFDTARIRPNELQGWERYPAGMAWSLRQMGIAVPNLKVSVVSNLPVGSGVSSSAALEMAFGQLWAQACSELPQGLSMAKLGKKCENEFVGVQSGLMDQAASMLGKDAKALFFDTYSEETQYASIPSDWSVVLCDTLQKRALAGSEYNDRIHECQQACRWLGVESLRNATLESVALLPDSIAKKRARHVVSENNRVIAFLSALNDSNADLVGHLMKESHLSLANDYQVSSTGLDCMAQAAWDSPGTIGARMTGAGFGGACVALVHSGQVEDFLQSTSTKFRECYGSEGSFLVTRASEGARPLSLS